MGFAGLREGACGLEERLGDGAVDGDFDVASMGALTVDDEGRGVQQCGLGQVRGPGHGPGLSCGIGPLDQLPVSVAAWFTGNGIAVAVQDHLDRLGRGGGGALVVVEDSSQCDQIEAGGVGLDGDADGAGGLEACQQCGDGGASVVVERGGEAQVDGAVSGRVVGQVVDERPGQGGDGSMGCGCR